MINFWVLCALLTVLACLFVVIPALRLQKKIRNNTSESEKPISSREQENVYIYKERLAELELEKDENIISDDLYTQRKQELEIALLNDVSQVDTFSTDSSNSLESSNSENSLSTSPLVLYSLIACSLVFISVFSFWLYGANGSRQLVDQYNSMNFDAAELDQAKELAKQGDMSALLNQLHEKLKTAPDNIEGWQLLARSSMNVQNYTLAAEAYEQIIRLYEANAENPAAIFGLLAQARYYQSEGKLSPEINQIIQKALALDENELNAIGLLAIDAFSNRRLIEAKDLWNKILTIYPEHPSRASIEAGIQRVNLELGLPEDEAFPGENQQGMKPASVVVNVSLSEGLNNLVQPSDTVFVIAKQVTGSVVNPNIPLAVSRHRVDELPLTVTLDDTKSMAPIAKLSMADSVMVIARVSKSGNPTAQSGDFEALSADINPKDQESIDLVIQTEVQ